MKLAREDQALLRDILKLGHELEARWLKQSPDGSQTLDLVGVGDLNELVSLVKKTELSLNPDFSRLSKWSQHLHSKISARHFSGILVPFERLSQRSLRDDEFLNEFLGDFLGDNPDDKSKIVHRISLVPVLENIRSAFNVGAIFRTAECWGLSEIVLAGYTPDPNDEKIAKTAMGTESDVPWSRAHRTVDAAATLKASGHTVIALETIPQSASLPDFKFPEKSALLLGNERFGLDPESLAAADQVLRIPLRGQKNSLNVGIAFGIAAYEYARQWGR